MEGELEGELDTDGVRYVELLVLVPEKREGVLSTY